MSTGSENLAVTILSDLDKTYASAVIRLYKQAWWSKDRSLASTATVIEGSTACFGAVNREGTLVAFARVLSDEIEKATIYDVIIDEEFRGKGLGGQLLNVVLSADCCAGVKHVELYCKEEMIGYYAELGFQDITDQVKLLRKS